jgi:branched-chain amino acid transport system ATP-binding protein
MEEPLLRLDHVSKRFGGLVAVNDVSASIEAGRVSALIGPNGAGKTTLFSIISGFTRPTRGRIFHRGSDITRMPPHVLARRGIARTFQIVQPFSGLNVLENIAVGAHLACPSRPAALSAAADIARQVGLGEMLPKLAASLTLAGRKRLELARALAVNPELLLLDEVLAGLNPGEVAAMDPIIRAIARRGVTILMIEHVMQAVMSLASHVFVLAEGSIVAQGAPRIVIDDRRVVEAYLGPGAAARLSGAAPANG